MKNMRTALNNDEKAFQGFRSASMEYRQGAITYVVAVAMAAAAAVGCAVFLLCYFDQVVWFNLSVYSRSTVYYQRFVRLFKERSAELFTELVTLLPDADKRRELRDVFEAAQVRSRSLDQSCCCVVGPCCCPCYYVLIHRLMCLCLPTAS